MAEPVKKLKLVESPSASHARVVQLVIDCHDCEGPTHDPEAMERMLRESAAAVGANILQVSRCDYVPHGVTMVAFLAESHLMVTTWPEHRFAIVEIMLCNEQMDPWQARDAVLEVLKPASVEDREVVHRMKPHAYGA